MKKFETILTPGQTTVESSEIFAKELLVVQKDGEGLSKIIFSGTPTDKQVKYTNLASTGIITFAQPGNQFEPVLVLYKDAEPTEVCVPPTIQNSVQMPYGTVGVPYSASFVVNGNLPVNITGETLPTGITVSVNNEFIQFSGTPTTEGDTTANFTIDNECGSVGFSAMIHIVSGVHFIATTAVSGDDFNVVEIANIRGLPNTTARVTLDTLTNNNGGQLRVNGAVSFVGNFWNVLLDSNGAGILNVEINGALIPPPGSSAILGHFTITSVTSGNISTPDTYQISKVFTG